MEFNWIALFGAALIPLAVGFVWYNEKVFGKAWMRASGLTPETLKGGNMGLIFGLAFLFALLLSVMLSTITIHQLHLGSILLDEPGINDPNSEIGRFVSDFMAKYGRNFRTFQHGAFHGILAAFFFVLPVLGTNALFERKGFKYIAVNMGYWLITLALMGGVICANL
ncbi:MAG: DUF1761 domain-containing protein [Saprospiraceae bacterium]|nr:DUF1761 domain-containing protein [Saprospiraceae bacterium]